MRRHLSLMLFLLCIVLTQLFTSWTDMGYLLTQLTMSAYYSLLVIGLCLLMGYAGQISLGHAGFFAIGGYCSAVLTTHNFHSLQPAFFAEMLSKTGILVPTKDTIGNALVTVHPLAAAFAAILLAAIIASMVGASVLKLKGHYLAMATLGFGIIIYRIVLAVDFLGQADGISEVPPFPLAFGLTVSGDFRTRIINYYIAWGLVFLGFILARNLTRSRVGRAMRAIHGSEEAASAMGVPTARYKLQTFMLSAVYAALAGAFLTHYNGGIGPSEAGIMKSVRYVSVVAIGGMANLWGALLMSLVLHFMSLRGLFGTFDDAVFGCILIVIMLFAPQGLLRIPLWTILRQSLAARFTRKDP